MKKLIFFSFFFLIFLFSACGPSEEEREKQKKHDDSLMEPERDAAIDAANKLLTDTTMATDTAKNIQSQKPTAKK